MSFPRLKWYLRRAARRKAVIVSFRHLVRDGRDLILRD
jgi:hypothetical protein